MIVTGEEVGCAVEGLDRVQCAVVEVEVGLGRTQVQHAVVDLGIPQGKSNWSTFNSMSLATRR